MNIIVMIPSLNPDQSLIEYVEALAKEDFMQIIVINDGSSAKFHKKFARIGKIDKCRVLTHKVNQGKGRALKTGIAFVMKHFPKCDGIVTVDADGQHKLNDVLHIAQAVMENSNRVILGSRDFHAPNIPPRSAYGNRLTSHVFALFFGQKLMDTQTGLRGIPAALLPVMLEIDGERYEYEMNMLIECRQRKIELYEIPIETVYIDENDSSHFRPVVDSVKIYWLICRRFLTYFLSSAVSMVVDLLFFTIFAKLVLPGDFVYRIQLATVVARVVSCTVNFTINKKIVFRKEGSLGTTAVKYFVLAVAVMLISANAVNWLYGLLHWPELLIKIIVDCTLFVFNYVIQKKLLFKK